MFFTADQIEAIVNELIELKSNHSTKQINDMTKFDDFKIKNKLFYETIIAGEFDHNVFKQMMAMKRKLESGEDQYSVDVKFGQFMSEKYIDPVKHKFKS